LDLVRNYAADRYPAGRQHQRAGASRRGLPKAGGFTREDPSH
jgi:hypothetical protein